MTAPQQPGERHRETAAEVPPRLAVDADGYVWRVYGDHWSMARTNPDNSRVPHPVTYYAPIQGATEAQVVTTTEVVTFKYDDAGRVISRRTETVTTATGPDEES